MPKPKIEVRIERGRVIFTLKAKRAPYVPRQKKARAVRPQSLGNTLRRVRLDRKISIKKLSEILGTSVSSVENWEHNRSKVSLKYKPGVFEFIGICPYDATLSFGARLKERREYFGLTTNLCAKILGVNPNSLSAWEREAARPNSRGLERIRHFLWHYRQN